jgi:hypothetical protein
MMAPVDSQEIAHRRMHNVRLSGTPFEDPEEVVRWFGAVQSQDYGPAKWSIGQRTSVLTDAAMDRLFAEGAILRTHVLRPTWHFILPEDIRWMLDLTAPRVQAINGHMYRQLELDDALRQKATSLLAGALRSGNRLTRGELEAVLTGAGVATPGIRLGYFLMHAELTGVICSGGLQGKQHTYALLDERAPSARSLTPDEALAELTLRYFSSHGPATAKDFRWWSSLTLAQIKKGLDLVAPRLEHAVVDGVTYWFAASAPPPKVPSPTVHLLQGYDECIVGYTESKYILDATRTVRSLTERRSLFNGVIILDSQVAGHWKRTFKKDAVIIQAALYTRFDDARTRALQAAADKHGEFVGLAATLVTIQP